MSKICGPGPTGISCIDWPDSQAVPPGWTGMSDAQCASIRGSMAMSTRAPHTMRIEAVTAPELGDATDPTIAPIDPLALVPIPDLINKGLSSAKNSTMIQILGMPRDHVDDICRMPTNRPLVDLIVTKNVGPFRVTGIKPAVKSLKRIFSEIETDLPHVHSQLGTAGMACVRFIKNSSKLSNHSWGCAIDIKIGAVLDGIQYSKAGEDGVTLAGLVAIAPYFHKEGWYWGVGFSSFEDGMHFEVADETIRKWKEDGKLGDEVSERSTTSPSLSIGDRGLEVKELQRALASKGFDILVDGVFGPITHGLVIDFQSRNGLAPNGVVDRSTREALNL